MTFQNLRMNKPITLLVLLVLTSAPCLAQGKQPVPVCRQTTFAAFKPLPTLSYDCPADPNESDDKILTIPDRLEALSETTTELESFAAAAWWRADVAELNACEIHGQAGDLTAEEKENYTSGDYGFRLFGNNSVRLVLLADPCYQTGYNGSVAFLLSREHSGVFVTRILDGYYSRIDNSVGVDFATLDGRQIIEVSTANSMPPWATNYYFVIDPRTHRAVPRKIFRKGRTLTNEISSALILGEPEDFGLPRDAKDLQVIDRNRLLPSFSSYSDTFAAGDVDARKLKRTVYHWNGRFYAEAKVHSRRRSSTVRP